MIIKPKYPHLTLPTVDETLSNFGDNVNLAQLSQRIVSVSSAPVRRVKNPSDSVPGAKVNDGSDGSAPVRRVENPSGSVSSDSNILRDFSGAKVNDGSAPVRDSYKGLHVYTEGVPRDESSTGEYSELAQMVFDSQAYKDAYALFSSDAKYGKIYLMRLESIPTSVIEADNTFWDKIGLSNNYDDVLRASYQRCIEQIQNLVVEYQQFINSLPTTQVEQLTDAGINSAITGQGVNGSSINPQSASTDPSAISSTNSGSYLSSLLGLLTTGIPNALSASVQMFSTLRTLQDNRNTTLANLWQSLSDSGYAVEGLAFNTWKDVEDFQQLFSATSSKAEIRKLQDTIDIFKSSIQNRLASHYSDSLGDYTKSKGITIEDFYNELCDSAIEEWVFTKQSNAKLAEYGYNLYNNLDPKKESDYENALNDFNKANADFEKYKVDLRLEKINNWIERVKDSNDPVVKQALVQYLMSVDDTYMGKFGKFFTDTASSAIGAFLGAKSGKGVSAQPANPYSGFDYTTSL